MKAYLMWHPDMPEEYKNQIVTGDARELAKRIPDESIDLIFTDPVYPQIEDYVWLSKTAYRVLKSNRACLTWCGIGFLPDTHDAMRTGKLSYRWRFIVRTVWSNEFHGRLVVGTQECLWYEKGKSKPLQSIFDLKFSAMKDKAKYFVGGKNWGKSIPICMDYIETFCESDGTVVDYFGGQGTTAVACKLLGRNYIVFEIDPETAELARERVRNTQPPLFVMEPEQLELK